MTSQSDLVTLNANQRNELEALLLDFESAWTPHCFGEWIDQANQHDDATFRRAASNELVRIDLQRQWTDGQGELLEDYVLRVPTLGSNDELSPHLILAEFEARSIQERDLSPQSYRERFPHQFDEFLKLAQMSGRSSGMAQEHVTLPPVGNASVDTSRIDGPKDTKAGHDFQIGSPLPEQFGRYRILRELGAGAMGSVHLAHDSQLDRQVALKTPSFNGVDHDSLVERFYREARAAAKLQHRNICPVYDVGQIDGRHFISMAFIKGRCMSTYIKPGKLPPVKTSTVLIHRLAMALAEAHHQNVIHRDLKPANIMIDTNREPVVMDFGLARRIDVESRMTQTGMAVGTPAYMSPEQVRGDQDAVGPASDIYSLGVIFYELLTGQLPFRGQIAQVVYAIVHEDPAPPSSLCPELAPELEQICLKMMAKDPEDRFPSMDAVASAIKDFLQSKKRQAKQRANSDSNQQSSATNPGLDSHSETNALNAFFAAQSDQADQSGTRTLVEASQPFASSPMHKSATQTAGAFAGRARFVWIAAGLAGVVLVAAALGIILLLKTPYGTLRVETIGEIEGLEVLVDGEVVSLLDANSAKATDHEFQLRLGDNLLNLDPDSSEFILSKDGEEQRISVTVGGVELSSNRFTVARHGETVLKIELLPDVNDSGGADIKGSEITNQQVSSPDDSNPTGPEPTVAGTESRAETESTDSSAWEILGVSGWSFRNGVIIGEPPKGTKPNDSWLATRREYDDFEMEFEYKLEAGGNSGVYFRTPLDGGKPEKESTFEIQLLDDTSPRYATVEDTQLNGSVWNRLPVNQGLNLSPNQWHRMRIRAMGQQLTVWSNDVQIVDGQLTDTKQTRHPIALQLLNGIVQFRNINIRELNGSETAVVSPPTENAPNVSDATAASDERSTTDIPLWDSRSGETSRLTIEAGADMRILALAPDGRTFAATGIDTPGEVTIWDAYNGTRLRRFRVDQNAISDFAYSPDGTRLIVALGRSVRVISSDDGRLSRSREFPAFVSMAAFHKTNRVACIYSEYPATEKNKDPNDPPRHICIWDWESNEILDEQVVRAIGNTAPHTPNVSPNDQYLSLCMRHLHVRFDIVPDGEKVAIRNQTSLQEMTLPRGPLVFSNDAKLAAAARKNRRSLFVVFNTASGRILHELDGERSSDAGASGRLAFAPDNQHLVVADMKGGVSLWNARTGTLVQRLYSHIEQQEKYGPPGILVTSDGRLITAGGPTDRRIFISQLPFSN